MSLGNKIKNIFFTRGEDSETKESTAEATETETVIEVKSSSAPEAKSGVGEVKANVLDQIATALESENLPGFDYFEYAKAVLAQEKLIPSEKARYQSVYATAKAAGMTMETLTNSANHYVGVLAEFEDEFRGSVAIETQSKVTERQNAADGITRRIDTLAEQKAELEKKVNDFHDQRTEFRRDAARSETAIQAAVDDFNATITVFRSKITSDLEKIQEYLVETKEEKTDG